MEHQFNYLNNMKKYLFLLTLLVAGCEEANVQTNVKYVEAPTIAKTNIVEQLNPRFLVKSQGYFTAGYDNAKREILLVEDTQNKVEYIAITDCSLIKAVDKKRAEAAADAAEAVADALSAIAGD
jgi:hypothetical protein